MAVESKRLEERAKLLEAENAVLRDALDVAGVGLWSWDFEDMITLDERASRLIGLPGFGSATVSDVLVRFHEDGHERLLDTFDRARRLGEPFDEPFALEAKGQRLRIQGRLSGDGCKLLGTWSFAVGIEPRGSGARSDAGATAHFQKDAFVGLPSDVYIEQDYNGHLVWMNPACEALSGFDSEELIGRPYLGFVHPEDITRTRQQIERVISGEALESDDCSQRFENRCRCKNGEYIWVFWTWGLDPDRCVVSAIGRDITEEKLQQERLAATLEQVQASNAELQSFASVASHDLREPLRMISSYLRLLQERSPDALDARAQRYINYACEGADRMRSLIEDLLSYSRLGSAGRAFEPVALDEVMEGAIGNLSVAIKSIGAEVTVDINNSPVVSGDRSRLVRLFQNLIGNSIKFHHEGNTPRVSVSFVDGSVAGEPDHWVIAIKDNGIGIDPDHLEILFNVFQRLNTRDEYEGSGIGLAVCKKIAEQHDGRIWVASEVGQGSTFYVTLAKLKEASIRD